MTKDEVIADVFVKNLPPEVTEALNGPYPSPRSVFDTKHFRELVNIATRSESLELRIAVGSAILAAVQVLCGECDFLAGELERVS